MTTPKTLLERARRYLEETVEDSPFAGIKVRELCQAVIEAREIAVHTSGIYSCNCDTYSKCPVCLSSKWLSKYATSEGSGE